MRHRAPVFFMTILMFALLGVPPSCSIDFKGGLEILEDYRNQKNYRLTDGDEEIFDMDAAYNLFSVYPGGSFLFTPQMKADMLADITCFSSIDGEEESDTDLSMVRVSMTFQSATLAVDGGLIPVGIGGRHFFSGDEPAIRVSGQISRRHLLTVQGGLLYHRSPFITAEMEYRMGFLETLKLFGAFLKDEDDSAASLSDRIESNTGSIFWMGGAVDFFIGNAYFSGIALIQTGAITLVPEKISQDAIPASMWQNGNDQPYDISLSGYLYDLTLGINLARWLRMSAFFFMASGDSSPLDRDFEGFISLRPDIVKMPVFFEGIGAPLSDDGFNVYGVDWQGVMAPGAGINLKPDDRVSVDISFFWLYPQETRSVSDSKENYGWELDTTLLVEWKERRNVFAEIGLFCPGSYFSSLTPDPEWVGRGRVGFNLMF